MTKSKPVYEQGHAIGLGLDLFSEMYQPANNDTSLNVTFSHDLGASILALPFLEHVD